MFEPLELYYNRTKAKTLLNHLNYDITTKLKRQRIFVFLFLLADDFTSN